MPNPFQWNKEQVAGKFQTPEHHFDYKSIRNEVIVDYANGDVRAPKPRNAKEQAELDKEIAEIREGMLDCYQRGF